MKKLFALLAVVLAVVSCQRDADDLNVAMGGEQEVMLTVSLPEATRANSAEGFDIANIADTKYTLRYILEIYRVAESGVLYDTCQRFVETSDGNTMAFPVRLAPGYDYRVAAWADIVVDNGEKADRCYTTTNGLDAITIIENMWNPMDETRDAYTGLLRISDFGNGNASTNYNITLQRPFAKVRVVATDIADIRKVGLEPTTATMSYSENMYRTFNAVADTKINETDRSDAAERKDVEYTYVQGYYEAYSKDAAEFTLFTDYIFVPASGTAKFTLTVKDQDDRTIKGNSFNTEIFVERNKLTTIKGDVLTLGENIVVNVDGRFDGETEYKIEDIKSGFSLQQAINEARDGVNTVITLGADINDGTFPITIPENKVITVKLNGKKITAPEESTDRHKYAFDIKGALTLEGEGEVKARGIYNYGTLTLESGTINACDGNGGYGVRNYGGATFTMNGGSIVTSLEDGDIPKEGYDASPIRVDEGATATINGGAINNVSNFTFAIDNYGTTTINDGTFTTIHTTIANKASMTINGGSFTCNGLEGVTAHALWADAGTTTINGGTFNGKDNYNGFNVDASAGAVVNIYGGKFLPVHSGSLYGEGTINVMGGEFFDDPSARVATGYLTIKINDTLYTVMKGSVDNGVNTYVIENAMDLTAFSSIVDKGATFKDAVVKLTEDIDCFKGYMEDGDPISTNPIGRRDYTKEIYAFCGTFDGDGHSIKNLYQNGWALGYESGVYGAIGLFSKVQNATIKNLTMDGCEMFVESGNVAVIAGNAEGDCTFENITIKNSTVCSYNNGVAGIVAWSETGNYTFKNIVLEDTFTVASFWGAHGTYLGGVVAEVYADCSYKFEDIVINCRLDAYNDVVSNYQWYAYRCGGMIAGNVETTQEINGTVYPNPAGCNITCSNVTVNYGDWMNYHYCESPSYGEPSYADEGEWKFHRVEPGYSWAGVDHANCNHGENESHYVYIPFDQLFGGGQNGSGHNPVYGLASYEGVTVNYPTSYVRGVSDQAELKKAIAAGISHIALESDITVEEWVMFSEDRTIGNGDIITIDEINLTIDGNGHTLTINDVESAGNGGYLFQGASVLNISNLTIKYADGLTTGGLGMHSGVIKDVDFIGGGYAILPGDGEIKVENCKFTTKKHAIYFEKERDNLTVTDCTFNQDTYAIILRGDVKFTDNIINNGNVTVRSGSPVITGNNFYNNRFKVYGAATATISNNTINNLEFDGTTYASTFSDNTLSAAAQAALNAATKVN